MFKSGVGHSLGTDEAREDEVVLLSGVSAVLIYLSDGQLATALVLGVEDSVGDVAFTGDINVNALLVLISHAVGEFGFEGAH